MSVRSYLTSMSDRPVFDTFAFDCPDPRALAGFYVELLGYSVSPESEDDWVTITGPGPTMTFQLAPDHVPSTWPMNDVPEQAHIDFLVTDIAAAHERVISLGGRAVDPVDAPKPSPSQGFRVYTDPPATASACAGPRRRLGDRSPVDGKDEAPGHCCSWSHRTFRGVLTPCLQIPQNGLSAGSAEHEMTLRRAVAGRSVPHYCSTASLGYVFGRNTAGGQRAGTRPVGWWAFKG